MSSTPTSVNVFGTEMRRGPTSKHHSKPNGYRPIRHVPKSALRSNHNHRHQHALNHRSNSTQNTDYRLYKGLDNVRRGGSRGGTTHKHHNSLASNVNHHGRGNTMKYLDESLDIIDGDIPSQKEVRDFFDQQRVRISNTTSPVPSLSNRSRPITPIDVIEQSVVRNGTGTAISAHSMGGTMKHLIGSPLDENEVIEFEDGIEMEEYTEDEDGVDPMKLIAAKTNLKSPFQSQSANTFPDTVPVSKTRDRDRTHNKRRTNNTLRSPVPSLGIGDLTPSSVHIRNSDSDNDTYSDDDDEDEDEVDPEDISMMNNGHQSIPRSGTALRTKRSNTVSNLLAMTRSVAPMKSKSKISGHRHSNSLTDDSKMTTPLTRDDLMNLYRATQPNLAQSYFSNLAKAATKSTQSVAERRARDEMEKKYKPQLQKTQFELDAARRKSIKQQDEIQRMKSELEELRFQRMAATKAKNAEKGANQVLRAKNLEIQELQSLLKFEKQRNQIQSASTRTLPVVSTTIPNSARSHSPISRPNALSAGTTPLMALPSRSFDGSSNSKMASNITISTSTTRPGTGALSTKSAPLGLSGPSSITATRSMTTKSSPTSTQKSSSRSKSNAINRRHSARYFMTSKRATKDMVHRTKRVGSDGDRNGKTSVIPPEHGHLEKEQLFQGLNRLKQRASTSQKSKFISMEELKKRKSR